MRQSPGPRLVQQGWTPRSRRPRLKSKPTRAGDPLAEVELALQRHRAAAYPGLGTPAGVGDPRRQRHQLAPQRVEQSAHDRAGDAGLVILDQRVVGLAGVAHALRLRPLELHDALEMGTEALEFRGLPGRGPRPLRHRGAAGEVLDQLPGKSHEPLVVAAQLADVDRGGRGGIRQERRALQLVQQLAQPGIGAALVQQAGEERELLAAALHGARGHARLLVPFQQRLDRGQGGLIADHPHQLVVGLLGSHALSPSERHWPSPAAPASRAAPPRSEPGS